MEKTETEVTQATVTQPTYQQNLLIDNLQELFNAVRIANLEHDKRAEKLAAVAGGIVAFVGGASCLPGSDFDSYPVAASTLLVVFILAVIIFYRCAKVWIPSGTYYPTVPDTDTLYSKYIAQHIYDAYNQFLSSLVSCIEDNRAVNRFKSEAIDGIVLLVQLQITSVALVLIFKSIGW